MTNVIPNEGTAPRRTLFAAGMLPPRDAMYRRADCIRTNTLPIGGNFALQQFYTTTSRMARMIDAGQVSLESAWVYMRSALDVFERETDEGMAVRDAIAANDAPTAGAA